MIPGTRPAAPWRLAAVEVADGAILRVAFIDGTHGEVQMQAFLASPGVDGTVFESLRQAEEFANAPLVMGAVQWPNGADLAPDAMYDAIRERGVWVLE